MTPASPVRRSERLKRKHRAKRLAPMHPLKKSKIAGVLRPYTYHMLNDHQIRVLELLPGEREDPLRGVLRAVDLSNDPRFDAVSYVWGDPQARCRLLLDDTRVHAITTNVHNVLTALRLTQESRVIWIDAICINQNDVEERNHQVKLMGTVYKIAQTVRVWLDVDVDIHSRAFRAINRLKTRRLTWLPPFGPPKLHDLRESVRLEEFSPEFWQPLAQIFSHQYWERVWTQQELFLANRLEFHFPRGTLSPDILIRYEFSVFSYIFDFDHDGSSLFAARMFSKSLFVSLYHGFHALQLAQENPIASSQTKLLNLFLESRDLKTADFRDRVYGMIGLAGDCEIGEIEPNYRLSRPDTYSQIIEHHIRRYHDLNFLCYYSNHGDHSIPSWLPSPEKESTVNGISKNGNRAYAATSQSLHATLHQPRLRQGILSVRGIKCDTIKISGATRSCRLPVSEFISMIDEASRQLQIIDWMDHVVAWISLPTTRPRTTTESRLVTERRDLLSILTQGDVSLSLDELTFSTTLEQAGIAKKVFHFARDLRGALKDSTFIGTHGKRLGICYNCCSDCYAKPDDEIWVLFGCSMPVLLRPDTVSSSGTYYKIIGHAFLDGLMDGEACKGILSDGSVGPHFRGLEPREINLI